MLHGDRWCRAGPNADASERQGQVTDRVATAPEGQLTLGLWYSQADQLAGTAGIIQNKLFGTD